MAKRNMKIVRQMAILFGVLFIGTLAAAQDKKFYIFLCFGQSNMEGNARIQPQDTVGV